MAGIYFPYREFCTGFGKIVQEDPEHYKCVQGMLDALKQAEREGWSEMEIVGLLQHFLCSATEITLDGMWGGNPPSADPTKN